MILDCAWAPGEGRVFATAGREKTVKIWARDGDAGFSAGRRLQRGHPVTAVDFGDALMSDGKAYLAVGTESGRLRIYTVDIKDDFSLKEIEISYARYVVFSLIERPKADLHSTYPFPSKPITQLAWKPSKEVRFSGTEMELAIASEDSSLRIYSFDPPSVS
jgi:elongator complex protein 2